jgi:hypothetical protein
LHPYWIEQAPIWLIGLVILAVLCLAHELGFRASRRFPFPKGDGDEGRGYLVSAALALLGLLMAFTFGAAEQRFNTRQQLALDEANALGTTYLRFQMLDEPWRADLSRQMLQYVAVREAFFTDSAHAAKLAANTQETARRQDRMWKTLEGAVRASDSPELNPTLLATTNEMFDLAASRLAVQETRIPIAILRMLALYTVVAILVSSYAAGAQRRYPLLSTSILALVAIAFSLILDLDRPSTGAVTVNQASIGRAAAAIRDAEAAKLAAAPATQ